MEKVKPEIELVVYFRTFSCVTSALMNRQGLWAGLVVF